MSTSAAHAWFVTKAVVNEQLRYTPACECGWAGRSGLDEAAAAERALEHVRVKTRKEVAP